MIIDSHCHLHDCIKTSKTEEDFDHFDASTPEDLISRAKASDVRKIVTIGTSFADSLRAKAFTEKYSSDNCQIFWTYGVHPNELEKPRETPTFAANTNSQSSTTSNAKTSPFSSGSRPLAIGEIGLDYHYGPEFYKVDDGPFKDKIWTADEIRQEQIKLLEEMLDLATKNDLPVSFHIREAFDDFLGIINNFPTVRGVIHSFTDSKKNLKRVLDKGFYIGVNGIATYSTLPLAPLDRTLTETDSPWLAPKSRRHTTNEPSYVREVVEWLATQHNKPLKDVETQIEKNFLDLFGR